MKENINKTQEQNRVLQCWKDSNFIGTYVGFTGVGKTRIGTIAASEFIRRDSNETSLVIVPTENLRDREWEQSFTNWGYQRERAKVQIECIQTAYKYKDRYWDTIVIDEWHSTLGAEYKKLILNNKYKRLLCLTATIDDSADKLAFTQSIAPIICTTPRERAISLKLVSESMIYNMAVLLTPQEQTLYNEIDTQFHYYEEALGGKMNAFNTSGRFLRLSNILPHGANLRVFIPENRVIYADEANDVTIPTKMCRTITSAELTLLREKIFQAKQYWEYMRKRRSVCFNAYNKIPMVKAITDRYPDRKGLIFSYLTSYCDEIANTIGRDKCGTFHSNMKKERYAILTQFSNNELMYLSSVKALQAGLDVPECSLGISTSADSKKLAHIQRNGRISRYIDGKVSYFINLYAQGTQELTWIKKGTATMEPKWIESIDELPIN